MIPEFTYYEETAKKNAREMFAIGRDYQIDRWHDDVLNLSMPTILVEVENDLMSDLFDGNKLGSREIIINRLKEHMTGRTWFIRLNTRSPKDAAYPNTPFTSSAEQAVDWIMTSMRCLDDVSMLVLAEEKIYICLRGYVPIDVDREIRCFVKDGELIGMSRYNYGKPRCEPEPPVTFDMVSDYYILNLKEHYRNVVFDLHVFSDTDHMLLIEVNPFGYSDPCLFESYDNIGGVAW